MSVINSLETNQITSTATLISITSETVSCVDSQTSFSPKSVSKGSSFSAIQNSIIGSDLTDEEISQECEAARQEIYQRYYAER